MLAEHLGVSTGLLPVTWYSGALRLHTPLHVPFCTKRPTLKKKTSTVATLVYHLFFKMSSKNKKGKSRTAAVENSTVSAQLEESDSLIKTAKELSESVTQIVQKELKEATLSSEKTSSSSSTTETTETLGKSAEDSGVTGDSEFLSLKSSREDEKDYLIRLNRRFAIVVEQNARLERENEKLAQELEMNEVTRKKTIEEVIAQQSQESESLRAQLREEKRLSGEKDKNISDLEAALANNVQQRDEALAKLAKAERKTLELESKLGAEKKKVETLEETVRSLEDQNSAIGGKLEETRKTVESQSRKIEEEEIAWEKEKQELVLQRQITETDSVQRKTKYEENLRKVDEERAKEYEDRLGRMVDLLRKEMERKMVELREALELFRVAEVGETEKKWRSEVSRVREEMEFQLESLEQEKRRVEALVEQVRMERMEEKRRFEKLLEDRRTEVEEERKAKGLLLDKWRHLLETKTTFQSELSVYDVLLQHEESRISKTDANNNSQRSAVVS